MRVIRRTFANFPRTTLMLGRAGENLVTRLELDISKELREFSNPTFELVLKMPALDEPYPVVIEVVGDKLYYTFSGSDLSKEGYGEVEALVSGENGEILKSATARAKIEPSIIPNAYPGPLQKVIDDIIEEIGEIEAGGVKVVSVLPADADLNTIVYLQNNELIESPLNGLYLRLGTSWLRISDDRNALIDYATVLKFAENSGQLVFDGKTVQTIPVDDVQLLEQTTYEHLYLCTEGAVPVLENIPTELTGVYFVYSLNDGDNYIQISESVNAETGLPLRMLTVHLDGENYTYLSDDGWQDSNFDPCDAPVITNFTVQSIRCFNTVYDDFSDLPAEAQSALKLLSQIVHTTPDRVDNPYFSENTVLRFGGTIEPNRKYAFIGQVFDLTLPTVPWQAEDVQFVLYLTCNSAVGGDVGFPEGTMFIGGSMSIEQGVNKIIGTWNRNEGCWMIGSVTAEAAS